MTINTRNFYRRHRVNCPLGHKAGSFSRQFAENHEGQKPCDCRIVVSGIFNGKFQRQNTGTDDWQRARDIVEQWDDRFTPISQPKQVGRPVLPKGQARDRTVPVRFNAQDFKKIFKAAKKSRLTLSEWVRRNVASVLEG